MQNNPARNRPGKRRRLGLAAVGAALLAALAACSSSGSSAGGTVTLRFVASTTTQAGFSAEIARFEAANPKIKIQATFLPIEQVQTQLNTQLAAGNAPDLFITNPGTGILGVQKLGQAGQLASLDDSAWKATVPAANLAMLESGGSVYGYPSSEVLYFVTYNKTAYATLGLTPPATLAQLGADCVQAKKAGKVMIALTGGATNLLALTATQFAVNSVYSATPDWNALRVADRTTFAASSGWQQLASEFATLKNDGCFQADAASAQFPNAVSLFTSGQALSMITFSTQVGGIVAEAKNLSYAAYPLPGTTAAQTRLPVATSVTMSVNAKSANLAAAEKFVSFLAKPAQAAAYAKTSGDVALAAANKGILPSYMSALTPLLSAGETIALPIFTWPAQAYTALGVNAQGMLTGQVTASQWLKALDQGWDS